MFSNYCAESANSTQMSMVGISTNPSKSIHMWTFPNSILRKHMIWIEVNFPNEEKHTQSTLSPLPLPPSPRQSGVGAQRAQWMWSVKMKIMPWRVPDPTTPTYTSNEHDAATDIATLSTGSTSKNSCQWFMGIITQSVVQSSNVQLFVSTTPKPIFYNQFMAELRIIWFIVPWYHSTRRRRWPTRAAV